VSQGLKTTFQLLARTDNDAAGRVLLAALDSPRPEIQEGALRAILRRPNGAGHREVLKRIDDFDDRWKGIVREHAGRMAPALRDAIAGGDPDLCRKACLAVVWFRQYDLAPALLGALEGRDNQSADLLGRTLLDLVDALCSELGAPREDRTGRDPQLVRRHLVGSLELSVKRFVRHRRREVLEAFVVLVYRDNITLKQVLEDPHDSAFVAMMDLLAKSPHPSVIGLLLSFLEDPHAPSAVLSVISRRRDVPFVDCLLQRTGRQASSIMAQNLRRMESIAWVRAESGLIDQLDDLAQHAAVRLVMTSGVPRPQVLALVESMLLRGKPGGRRAAAEALGEFHGAEANQLVLQALGDEDPEVQARAVKQLRGRGIPGAMTRLIESLDSPHAAVRRAARESLTEFSFERFVANFDFLDDDVRRGTGVLVRKVVPARSRNCGPNSPPRCARAGSAHWRSPARWRSFPNWKT
jgi:hypothetical protein